MATSSFNIGDVEGSVKSLSDQITTLNSKITSDSSSTVTVASGITKRAFTSVKFGNVVVIAFQFDVTSAKRNQDVIFSDIPSDYRPNRVYISSVQAGNNTPCSVAIQPNGTITVGGSGMPVGSWYGGEIVCIH